MKKEVLYRYEDVLYGSVDPYREIVLNQHTLKIELREYPIIKKTPKGTKIDISGKHRIVRDNAKNQFACKTKEEAILSFIFRKKRQLEILTERAKYVKIALAKAENL